MRLVNIMPISGRHTEMEVFCQNFVWKVYRVNLCMSVLSIMNLEYKKVGIEVHDLNTS